MGFVPSLASPPWVPGRGGPRRRVGSARLIRSLMSSWVAMLRNWVPLGSRASAATSFRLFRRLRSPGFGGVWGPVAGVPSLSARGRGLPYGIGAYLVDTPAEMLLGLVPPPRGAARRLRVVAEWARVAGRGSPRRSLASINDLIFTGRLIRSVRRPGRSRGYPWSACTLQALPEYEHIHTRPRHGDMP